MRKSMVLYFDCANGMELAEQLRSYLQNGWDFVHFIPTDDMQEGISGVGIFRQTKGAWTK